MSLKYSNLARVVKKARGGCKSKSEGLVIAEFRITSTKLAVVKLFKGKVYLDIRKYEKGRPTRAGITLNEFEIDKLLQLLERVMKAVDSAIKLKTDSDPPAEIFMCEGDGDEDNTDYDDEGVDGDMSGVTNGPTTSKRG